jgi:uncharacterized membrane protein YkoI
MKGPARQCAVSFAVADCAMVRFLVLCVLVAMPARAGLDDYEQAREALERNEVMPLADILPLVQDQFDARMIEVEFEQEEGQYIYEFELITPDGRLLEAVADAKTGAILRVEEDQED